jgi:hypothetical protein
MSFNDSLLLAIERLAPIAKMKSVSIDFRPDGRPRVQARESELRQLWDPDRECDSTFSAGFQSLD